MPDPGNHTPRTGSHGGRDHGGCILAHRGAGSRGSSPGPVLDIAEWSYFWYGVEHATLARGTVCNGMQMYVEHWIPTQVKHPYPVVLVHGGYGQGSDWLATPDGRRGWASCCWSRVQGLRSGPAGPGPQSLSSVSCTGISMRKRRRSKPLLGGSLRRNGRQWRRERPGRRANHSVARASRWATTPTRETCGARAGRFCWTKSGRRSSSLMAMGRVRVGDGGGASEAGERHRGRGTARAAADDAALPTRSLAYAKATDRC